MQLDGYTLMKAWFDFAKDNASKIKPIHASIYFLCINKNNEQKWAIEFQLPTDNACNLLGIAKKDTFLKALKELVEMGAIRILKESKNIYTARYISLYDCPFYRPKKRDTIGVAKGTLQGSLQGSLQGLNKTVKQIKQIKEQKQFLPPSLNDVLEFFKEKGYTETSANKAFEYYQVNEWKDSKGNQVKNWKQKMIGVWMKDENKIQTPNQKNKMPLTRAEQGARERKLKEEKLKSMII